MNPLTSTGRPSLQAIPMHFRIESYLKKTIYQTIKLMHGCDFPDVGIHHPGNQHGAGFDVISQEYWKGRNYMKEQQDEFSKILQASSDASNNPFLVVNRTVKESSMTYSEN